MRQTVVDTATLGGRLRSKRQEHGWTQEELAAEAETTQAVIQKIENGKSLRPRRIDCIARALSVSPAWLLFGTDGAGVELGSDALEVARAWARLREPQRSRLRQEILDAATRRLS